MQHTFHYLVYPGHQVDDLDGLHSHKCHPRPDADACVMNDVTNVVRAMDDHVRDHDVYDG